MEGSPPRTRGARGRPGPELDCVRITPAHAGSTWHPPRRGGRRQDHPRARGEHCLSGSIERLMRGSPPRTRGARPCEDHGPERVRITPAHAGSTCGPTVSAPRPRDHPRARGEHVGSPSSTSSPNGSPPRTRGAPQALWCAPEGRGSPPRTRGAHGPRSRGEGCPLDHPRARGEHLVPRVPTDDAWGSPPRTRGARLVARNAVRSARITPAHAGSTWTPESRGAESPDHPRARGEHIGGSDAAAAIGGSPPRTRGAPFGGHVALPIRRITPAHAGSTPQRSLAPARDPDHPRARGEHMMWECSGG